MNREELIEEAREWINSLLSGNGFGDDYSAEELNEWAESMLAMFEKAHAPELSAASLLDLANRIGATERSSADFDVATSRPLGPEPQVIERHDLVMPIYDEPQGDDRTHEFANMAAIMGIPEPQGEPSNAQVKAAFHALYEVGDNLIVSDQAMRAALRAANQVKKDEHSS